MNKKNYIIIGIIVIIVLVAGGVSFMMSNTKSTTKDIHQHSFSKATCLKPKTCTICGATEGKKLPHTTSIGKCTSCGKLQNEETAKQISDLVMSISENTTNCSNQIKSANLNSTKDSYNKFSSASAKLKENNANLEKVITLSSKFKELNDLKENANKLLTKEISISGSNMAAFQSFLVDFKEYLLIMQNLNENMSNMAKLYV